MGKGMRAGKKKKVGGGSGGSMQQQMKQLQAMQREMEETQAALGEKEVTATAGGGAVEAKVNGNKELVSLHIDPDVIDADDAEMLQDLIVAAVNEGMRQIDALVESEMSKVTGGLNMPGFGL